MLEVLTGLVGDASLAAELVSVPPIALFYGWMSLSFVPLLVTFTSSESISAALASGSCRYSLFRIDRLSWVSGKLVGQLLLMVTGILVGAAGVWVIGYLQMNNFTGLDTAVWLLRFSGRASVYGFAFLGVTLGLSQITRSVNGARAMALLALLALSVGGALLLVPDVTEYAPVAAETARQLFPNAHKLNLWRPDLLLRASAVMMLTALGLIAFGAGHQWMSRRDA